MQRSAIILARVLGFIEVLDLSPEGRVFFPDLVREIAERYNFQKFPQSLEEYDTEKGVEFVEGKFGNKVIQKFVIWTHTLIVETRTSTDESKAILEEILLWGAEKFGLSYKPGGIKRFAYISDVSFYSDVPLLVLNPALEKIAAKSSQALAEIWEESVEYEPISIKVGHDPTTRKFGVAPFSIERKMNAKFSDNKYFSEAPLPTHLHWEMLEQFEKDMQFNAKSSKL